MRNIQNISFEKVKLLDGFWKDKFNLNAKVSIYTVKNRFEETGRFDAFRFNYKEGISKLHFFYDSDVAKWIEAVGYLLTDNREKYNDLEIFCDELIDSMYNNQMKDGYLNSYFQQVEPTQIFKRRIDHELYCAGHLIEAAIAYDFATNKNKFLKIIKKYCDCIYNVFIKNNSANFYTCGHEEIELALFKLFDYTKNNKYLEMAKFFMYKRGNNLKDTFYNFANSFYDQSNETVFNLKEANGHAVRATYYYIAMADLYKNTNDEIIKNNCLNLFDDIINKKMYITGGIGSSRVGEAFTTAYDLPNLTAYSESCAAIGLLLFALKMQELDFNSKYADIIEKIIYNGFLSSFSIDGKSFFYENPLEISKKEINKEMSIAQQSRTILPPIKRKEVFDCSCCPPNINRILASFSKIIYAKSNDGLIINQYISSKIADGTSTIQLEENYINEGKVLINGVNYEYTKIYLRIPKWCSNFKILYDNNAIKNIKTENGYAVLNILNKNFKIEIEFEVKSIFYYSNINVRENAGKLCVLRGAMLYCLEEIDNCKNLFSLSINTNLQIEEIFNNKLKFNILKINGFKDDSANNDLYFTKIEKTPFKLTLIPYFAFANRKDSDMLVWIRYN